jgi:hypothetical protein
MTQAAVVASHRVHCAGCTGQCKTIDDHRPSCTRDPDRCTTVADDGAKALLTVSSDADVQCVEMADGRYDDTDSSARYCRGVFPNQRRHERLKVLCSV